MAQSFANRVNRFDTHVVVSVSIRITTWPTGSLLKALRCGTRLFSGFQFGIPQGTCSYQQL